MTSTSPVSEMPMAAILDGKAIGTMRLRSGVGVGGDRRCLRPLINVDRGESMKNALYR